MSSVKEFSQVTFQKGIVLLCRGTSDGQLADAYVAVRMIRDHISCDLPIEIAYYGTDELDSYHRSLFQVMAGWAT